MSSGPAREDLSHAARASSSSSDHDGLCELIACGRRSTVQFITSYSYPSRLYLLRSLGFLARRRSALEDLL